MSAPEFIGPLRHPDEWAPGKSGIYVECFRCRRDIHEPAWDARERAGSRGCPVCSSESEAPSEWCDCMPYEQCITCTPSWGFA